MLQSKTIVITGASRGIGKAVAERCAAAGAAVGINFLKNREAAEALARDLAARHGVRTHLLPFDVRDEAAVERACDPLLAEGIRIDGWVNNAAVNLPGLFLTQSAEQAREQIETNVIGPMNCCRYILKHMLEHRRGSIVNIGSAVRRRVYRGQAVYAATKGALASLTQALAYEYGPKGIRVNCIEPGPTQTDMFAPAVALAGEDLKKRMPLRRFGEPSEIAELAVFLLSDSASFITGGLHGADGGYSL